jgi:hypothetical protein
MSNPYVVPISFYSQIVARARQNLSFKVQESILQNFFFSNVQAGGFFALFESIGATLRSFSQPALPARGINKDPTLLLNGARPTPKYVFKNNMSLANS